MWLTVTLILTFLVTLLKLYLSAKPKIKLDHIPGPKTIPISRLITMMRAKEDTKYYLKIAEMARVYGPVMTIPRLGLQPFVILNSFESIYQVLVKSGKDAACRSSSLYRQQASFENTGIVFNLQPDERWKCLRKAAQGHLKPFGEGLLRLEKSISTVADNMLNDFSQTEGSPHDPRLTIFNTALQTVIYLLIGCQLDSNHSLVRKMKTYQSNLDQFWSLFAPFYVQILDFLPFLRNSLWPGYRLLIKHREMGEEIFEMVKHLSTTTDTESLTEVLQKHVSSGNISEVDAKQSLLVLLFAAVVTTSSTFYCAVNILAHNPDVQDKILEEIEEVAGNCDIQLKDRPNLPYTQATLLEINRYTSVVAFGSTHAASSDITADGVYIPKGTPILPNLWFLHHDPEFWGDPQTFRPERFLGEDGKVVPADHPRRKHLMPFGAGTRVCVGEAFAMARLFLWLTKVVQKFEILPAEVNSNWKIQPENYHYAGLISSVDYKVNFRARMKESVQ